MKGVIDTGRLKPNTGRTNQKLFFARLQMDRLAQVLAEKSAFSWEAEALSCREAAILHLHGAYVAFLQELVRFYKLEGALTTSEAVRVAMAARGQVAPEITVLQQLEADSASWLTALLKAWQYCLLAPEPAPAVEEQDEPESPVRAINLVTVAEDLPLSVADIENIAGWHRQLTGIIREFRSERVEF